MPFPSVELWISLQKSIHQQPKATLHPPLSNMTAFQQAFLTIAPKVTSSFSLFGTGWILIEVWVCSPKRYFAYHKLVSAMALYSFLSGVGYFWNASSTQELACNTQGFLLQLQLGTMMYFSMLGFFYVLAISYSNSEDQLGTWETFFHGLPFIISLGSALTSLLLGLYHPVSSWCWIDTRAYQWGLYLGPAWVAFGLLLASLAHVFLAVRGQEQKMKKYMLKAKGDLSDSDRYTSHSAGDEEVGGDFSDSMRARMKVRARKLRSRVSHALDFWEHLPRTQQVLSQELCYVASMFVCLVMTTLQVSFPSPGSRQHTIVSMFQAILQPLQGFFIFLSYRRPTYLRLRRKGLSLWASIKQTLMWEFTSQEARHGKRRSSIASRTSAFSGGRRSRQGRQSIIYESRRRLSIFQYHKPRRSDQGPSSRRPPLFPGWKLRWKLKKSKAENPSDKGKQQKQDDKDIVLPTRLPSAQEVLDPESSQAIDAESSPDHRPSLGHSGTTSASTLGTLRSSKEFAGLMKEGSLKMLDLVMHGSSSDDDEHDGDDDDYSSSNVSLDGEDEEKTQEFNLELGGRPSPAATTPARAHRRDFRKELRSFKQQSKRMFDLVCMDVIPGADEITTEQMRALIALEASTTPPTDQRRNHGLNQTPSGQRLIRSIPYGAPSDIEKRFHHSSGGFPEEDLPSPLPPPKLQGRAPPRNNSNAARLFAKIKANPLFQRSERNLMNKNDLEGGVSGGRKNHDFARAPPGQCASFDDMLSGELRRPQRRGRHLEVDQRFRAKLEMEQTRRVLLKTISSKRKQYSQRNLGNDPDTRSRQPKMSDLEAKRREILKTISKNRYSQRNLMLIREESETNGLESHHMSVLLEQQQDSSQNMSSNDISLDSKKTAQRSNANKAIVETEPNPPPSKQRLSCAEMTKQRLSCAEMNTDVSHDATISDDDDAVSLVSDGPPSINLDDLMSESSDDEEVQAKEDRFKDKTKTAESPHSSFIWKKLQQEKMRQDSLRDSLRELQGSHNSRSSSKSPSTDRLFQSADSPRS